MGQKVPLTKVAAEVGVHPRTIRRYVSSGRLTAWRVGPRLLRVDIDEARAVLLGELVHPE